MGTGLARRPGGREQLEHWTSTLADLPDVQLPADHPRPRSPTFAGAALDFEVPQPTYDALRRIGHAEGATLFMVTLAALQAVLQRYTDSDDIVVGTSVANRAHADVDRIVGYLVNTLVLRTDLAGDPTCRELVGRTRDVAMDAYGHQQVPFNMVVSALRPERVAGDNPLFHVHFQLFSEGRPSAEAGDLRRRPSSPRRRRPSSTSVWICGRAMGWLATSSTAPSCTRTRLSNASPGTS